MMACGETLPAQPSDANPTAESPSWQNQVDRYRQECIYKVCEQTGLDQATVLRSPELRGGSGEFLLSPTRLPPIKSGNLLYLVHVLEPPHHDVRYIHTGAPVDLSDKFVIKFGVTSDWKRRTQRLMRFEMHRKAYGPIYVLDTFGVGDHRGVETALKRALIDKGCLCTGRRRGQRTTDVELVAIDRKQSVYAELVGLVESAVRLHRDMPTTRPCLEEQLRADESHRETLRATAKIQLELEASKRQTLQEEIARLKLEYMEYGKRQRLHCPRAAAPVQEPAAEQPREPGPDDFCLGVHFPQLDGFYEATRRSS